MRLQNEMFTVVSEAIDEMQIRLNAEHFIYQAHFPGNPITPGVCIVQIIGELLQNRLGGKSLMLDRIVNLKFVSIISPTEHPEVTVKFSSVQPEEDECKVKGTLEAEGTVLTKFSVVFKYREL